MLREAKVSDLGARHLGAEVILKVKYAALAFQQTPYESETNHRPRPAKFLIHEIVRHNAVIVVLS